jgi:hypothetical protein
MSVVPMPSLSSDGEVKALAVAPGNVLYVGGDFGQLAPRVGHAVRYSASGAPDRAWPDVDGSVNAAVPDGAGGWFIGGAFSHVAGQRRARLAHIDASGALDPRWSPSARQPVPGYDDEATVWALCVLGDTVYVGGYFNGIDGVRRENLAAVDAVSGGVQPWDPRANDGVQTLRAAAGSIYVGGDFTQIGAARRQHLAAFDAATGTLTAWNPGVIRKAPSDPVSVSALTVDRGTLYVGGLFNRVAGRQREGIAAFELATGALSAWNPGASGSEFETTEVDAIVVAGDTVYVGGSFERMGAARRVSLAAVDAHSGQARPWRADVVDTLGDPGEVHALALRGDRLLVGGLFGRLAGRRRDYLGAVSTTSAALDGWNPRPNDEVWSLVAAGDGVLVGGSFSGVDSQPRDGIAAIDLDSGELLPFKAHIADFHPYAVALQDQHVYAAGPLESAGGRGTRLLAKFDARTGTKQRWDPGQVTVGEPEALAVHGRRLYVGGQFDRIGGRRRPYLAALDTRTGRATRWRANANGPVKALAIHGHTLYVAGGFTRLGGHRRRSVGAIDLRSGRLIAWNPNADGSVRTLAVANGRVYLGGDFRHVGRRRRSNLAAVNLSNGKLQQWLPRANAPVSALAVIADTVYAGGEFTSISGTPRKHLAATDGRTGAPTAWNPTADGEVSALLATPTGLIAGGSFNSTAGTSQQGLAIFSPDTP